MILPLNLTHVSAHICPSKYDPYIFLHCAQFRIQTPKKSKPDTESRSIEIKNQNSNCLNLRRISENCKTNKKQTHSTRTKIQRFTHICPHV